MHIDGLAIPDLLLELIESGRWPATADEAARQMVRPFIAEDRNRRLRRIQLYSPPFHTLAHCSESDFYRQFGALHTIAPELAIAIAEFGIGEDTPILLDYRRSRTQPRVIRLEWDRGGNEWIEMTPDFASFVELLGLQTKIESAVAEQSIEPKLNLP